MKKVFVIACAVLARDIEQAARDLQLTVAAEYLPGGLHEDPARLNRELQAAIDRASKSGKWDRIAIGYGVCGRGTAGIQAKEVPLSIARVHDCISLFLGGDRLYQEQFKRYPGTYYITEGWLAGKTDGEDQDRSSAWMGDTKVYLDTLEDQYGPENAERTFAFLNSWRKNYQRAAYIDTGSDSKGSRAKKRAMKMAADNGWKYEELKGNTRLLRQLLTAESTTSEIVVVPPQHVLVFDPVRRGLSSRPLASKTLAANQSRVHVEVVNETPAPQTAPLHFGLGVDAGGTYTDAVVYDFEAEAVKCKSKALTTRWDFTIGIREALAGLDGDCLKAVQLVSVSTTLATNAIVEGEGRKVGLLIMPPPGFGEKEEKIHFPQHCLKARLDITGKEIVAPDEDEIRRVALRMCDEMEVEAFAVSGYAGAINPEHELRIKRVLREETGKFVCCGHELSQLLNFKLRAETAVHNARIVPRVIMLLQGISVVLAERGISSPVMVVRGDGTLMGQTVARQRPVETILSGPAASMAGVRHLTKATDAIVVDMGGTTTDIAGLENGGVRLCSQGARVGSARTHVKALEIYTTGLGGDSFINYHHGQWLIGPGRVAPVAWLGHHDRHVDAALAHLQKHQHRFRNSFLATQLISLNHRATEHQLSEFEKRIVGLLEKRPHSLQEITQRLEAPHPGALPLKRLESHFVIQRCGLTPTDLLHAAGRFNRWDTDSALRMIKIYAAVSDVAENEFVSQLMNRVTKKLAMEIIASQLGTFGKNGDLESCRTCQKLFDTLFENEKSSISFEIGFHHPIIGVGAPISQFLPPVAELLGAEAVIPDHQDVANAIGAITSLVSVEHQMTIKPDGAGNYYIQGLPGDLRFKDVDDAETCAREALVEVVRAAAQKSGTHQSRVTIASKDLLGTTAHGEEIFLGRQFVAHLEGRPDLFR